jgi:RNA polymerase sigma factor (sigma-70 family)
MTNGAISDVAVAEGSMPSSLNEATDRHLLLRFVRDRDEAAFAVLVKRYGPMVLGVCRRILTQVEEAEDAFQATFLVLLRKASSIGRPELLGNWLYGVAYRIARKARAQRARRAQLERPTPPMTTSDPQLDAAWRELHAALDEELQRLPVKYRAPLILCYLEGLSNKEAARRLGWPTGSISYRLARGRELLRGRLQRRHPEIPPALMAALPMWGMIPTDLLTHLQSLVMKLQAPGSDGAATAITPSVQAMTDSAIRAMAAEQGERTAILVAVLAILMPVLLAVGWMVAPVFASSNASPPTQVPCHQCAPPAKAP